MINCLYVYMRYKYNLKSSNIKTSKQGGSNFKRCLNKDEYISHIIFVF